MVQVMFRIFACSTVQLALIWWFRLCTNYWMQYSATDGVLLVQVMYRLLHAVQCNWRCNNGSSDVEITACSTVRLALYWWFKWCMIYCMQYSTHCVVIIFQVIYRLLDAEHYNWRCINVWSDVQITACSRVLLPVYWWFKWFTEYCF